MNRIKIFNCILLLIIIIVLFSSCEIPRKPVKLLNSETVVEIRQVIAERIKAGDNLRDIVMPSTSVMVMAILIPIFATIGFFAVVFIFLKFHYKKVMTLIEKGIYKPQPLNYRWELLFLFGGLLLLFIGPGISLSLIGFYGWCVESLVAGTIPFLLGVAILIFYVVYKKIKNN